MKKFRYTTPTRKGRWRATVTEAREYAYRAGFGHKDEHSATVYLDPPCDIEWRDEP